MLATRNTFSQKEGKAFYGLGLKLHNGAIPGIFCNVVMISMWIMLRTYKDLFSFKATSLKMNGFGDMK